MAAVERSSTVPSASGSLGSLGPARPKIPFGPHVVEVVRFDVKAADEPQQQAAKEMAEQTRHELLDCYRDVMGGPNNGYGAARNVPSGVLTMGLGTAPDGTMTMRHLTPLLSASLNECMQRAFDGKPSSFPDTTMLVAYRFDRPLLAAGQDAGAGTRPPR